MEIIREGGNIAYNLIYAMNNSKIDQYGERPAFKDPEIYKQYKKLQTTCQGNKCYLAVRELLAYLKNDPKFYVPSNCRVTDITYLGDTVPNNYDYPCYRNQ